VLDNESHPIPPTQQLLGSALKRDSSMRMQIIEAEIRNKQT
jgi:hypothetical protein